MVQSEPSANGWFVLVPIVLNQLGNRSRRNTQGNSKNTRELPQFNCGNCGKFSVGNPKLTYYFANYFAEIVFVGRVIGEQQIQFDRAMDERRLRQIEHTQQPHKPAEAKVVGQLATEQRRHTVSGADGNLGDCINQSVIAAELHICK